AEGAAPGPKYLAKVEFALKLGYAEAQVQSVLAKLGEDALTNDLLGELILLQGGAGGGGAGGGGAGGGGPLTPHQPPPPIVPPLPPTDPAEDRPLWEEPTAMAPPTPATRPRPPALAPPATATGPRPLAAVAPPTTAEEENGSNLRPIVIDGSNVAMSHGNKEVFSCRGIALAVDWFRCRGHRDITVFVPSWRKEQSRPDAPITDQHVLSQLEQEQVVVLTPSRRVQGRRVVCYDDRFVLRLAHDSGGVVVSNDHYRDLQAERTEWRRLVEERLLMYSFVNDKWDTHAAS
ncbi:unnamed protein product, partial [Lampetra fluviatilis]